MESAPFVAIEDDAASKKRSIRFATKFSIGVVVVACVVAVSTALVTLSTNSSPSSSNSESPNSRFADFPGIVVPINDSVIALSVYGMKSFRVSVSFNEVSFGIDTPMVAPQDQTAGFTTTSDGDWTGIRTDFGLAQVNKLTGGFELRDGNGVVLTSTKRLAFYESSIFTTGGKNLKGTCNRAHAGYDVISAKRTPSCPNGLAGKTQATCCAACDQDRDCTVWVYALPGSESEGKNCWLLQGTSVAVRPSSSRVTGGDVSGIADAIRLELGKSQSSKFYGSGCGANNAEKLSQTSANPKVTNTEFYTPHYYSSDGYSALGVSALDFSETPIYAYPANWDADDSDKVVWRISGDHVDIFLTPSTNGLGDGLSKYWDLIGRPVVPPRYAFGFLACRWGWTDVNYISNILHRFRDEKYPIDAWISDFEWYTPQPDYTVPDQGLPDFSDFGYNAVTFPDPVNNLKTYHRDLHLRFGGIRKPRLGNSGLLQMAKSNGWTVDADHSGGAPGGPRNLNYSRADLRKWYADNHMHFFSEGVDFWWNDEGETFYFAFHWWNQAQVDALSRYDPRRRFFTINRSYTPGMQRLGAVQWTGDISQTWQSMQQQSGYVINWNLAGAGYVTADTGGFNGQSTTALMLARWYQVSAFSPIMRVHSNLQDTPHFPFLWGDEAGNSMRLTINLRYRFIPYHYSLAHAMYRPGGLPMFRPMTMVFPDDASLAEVTSQWMDGDGVLVCPITREDNSTSCYFPSGLWYAFDSCGSYKGPSTLQLTGISLSSIPLYVKAGTLLPLAPVTQYSDQLPGGPLEVQVYSGADGKFLLVEDDGETTDYQKLSTRDTTFTWNDSTKLFAWSTVGDFSDAHTFTQFQITLLSPSGPSQSPILDLTKPGSYQF